MCPTSMATPVVALLSTATPSATPSATRRRHATSHWPIVLVAATLLGAFALGGAPRPVAASGMNALKQSSFEATGGGWLAPWTFKVTSPAAATIAQDSATRSNGLRSARISISRTSATPWHVQLQQSGIPLVGGRSYELSLWARAASPRNLELALQRGVAPYDALVTKAFSITTSWAKYRVTYTPPASMSNAMLSLNLAKSTAQVWVDDVAVWTNATSKLGVSGHLTWGSGMPESRSKQTGWMQAGHMKWVRFDLGWRWVEPSRGHYSQSVLASLDATLADLQAKGIRPIIVLVETPAWANGNKSPWYPPSDPNDYARVIGMLAKRYAAKPDMTWEIWNEPNLVEKDSSGKSFSKYWMPLANPVAYTAMLKGAYASIKANDPDATVLGGSLVFYAGAFLDAMYAHGVKGYFDALAIHPYGFSLPPSDSSQYGFKGITERMKAALDAHGDSNKKLWITEVGWWDRAVTGNPNHPTDAMRADYYKQLAAMVDGWSFVECVTLFSLTKSTDAASGLFNQDGSQTLSWKAYAATADAED